MGRTGLEHHEYRMSVAYFAGADLDAIWRLVLKVILRVSCLNVLGTSGL